ncbi:MAG: hypothetical protein H7210_08165 [Pyrinomonadaceae bacterium]|nr:hypothetical protein [Phycisphaerales bacterium]
MRQAVAVAHNHPSGDPALLAAAKILQIELLDHVIVGDAKSDR